MIRVAGNIVDTDVTASIEYAIDHLDTSLVVVLGHSGCGAVTAIVDHYADPSRRPREVLALLGRIEPSVHTVPLDLGHDERVRKAVTANVALAVRKLSSVRDVNHSIAAGKARVVGGINDMHIAKVEMIQ